MKLLLIFCFISTLSCVNKTELTKNQNIIKVVNTDSIKNSLKDSIVFTYLNLSITKLSKNNIKYNTYSDFILLDSLINTYTKTNLTETEIQYLKIVKSKRYLLTANYDKAISELNTTSKDIEEYKNLLLGITYELKGDTLNSTYYFTKLLSKVDDLMINDNACSKYLLLNVLLNKEKLAFCEKYVQEYNNLRAIEKSEIIRIHFLSDIEL